MPYIKINKQSDTPFSQQIIDSILLSIQEKRVKHMQQLLPEHEVSTFYNIGVFHVKKAYDYLSNNGYIIRKQGYGTYFNLTNRSLLDIFSTQSIFTCNSQNVDNTSNTVLSFEDNKRDSFYSKIFNVPINSCFIFYSRIFFNHDIPFCIQKVVLIQSMFDELTFEQLSQSTLYSLLSHYKIQKFNISKLILSVPLSKAYIHYFQQKDSFTGLCATYQLKLDDARLIALVENTFNANHVSFFTVNHL